MYKYSIFKTPLGYMGAVRSEKGLHKIVLPRGDELQIKKELSQHYLELERDEKAFKILREKMRFYFEGQEIDFDEKMDLRGSTPFELKVWDMTIGIQRGEVCSYEWIAKQIGNPKEAQAVGQALGRNRLPIIIPCHRVIKKAGDIGGFSGGAEMKRKLLKLEGYLLC